MLGRLGGGSTRGTGGTALMRMERTSGRPESESEPESDSESVLESESLASDESASSDASESDVVS